MVQGRVAIPGQAASGLLAAAIIGAIAETHDGRTLRRFAQAVAARPTAPSKPVGGTAPAGRFGRRPEGCPASTMPGAAFPPLVRGRPPGHGMP